MEHTLQVVLPGSAFSSVIFIFEVSVNQFVCFIIKWNYAMGAPMFILCMVRDIPDTESSYPIGGRRGIKFTSREPIYASETCIISAHDS